MSDDLEVLMKRVGDEGPDPEFLAALRARIVAETEAPSVGNAVNGRQQVVEISIEEPSDAGRTLPTRFLVAAAAAVILVVGLVVTLDSDDSAGRLEIATDPEWFEPPSELATFDASASLIDGEDLTLDPGTYRFDTLGTPFSLTLDESFQVWVNERGLVVLGDPRSRGTDDRELAFVRVSSLADPSQPVGSLDPVGQTWPADDFSGWLDALGDHIVVTSESETTLAGAPAVAAQLELGSNDCAEGSLECVLLGVSHAAMRRHLNPNGTYRVWIVEQESEDPLMVIASIDHEAEREWFETADAVLASLALGPTAPSPILGASGTSAELPFLGGIQVDLPADSYAMVDPSGFGVVPVDGWEAISSFLANPQGLDGSSLTTVDDIVGALVNKGMEATELEPMLIDGFDSRVVDLVGGALEPALLSPDGNGTAWLAPRKMRLWLIDHPERGVLVIGAEAGENVDFAFPAVLAQTEAMIDTLRFVESS